MCHSQDVTAKFKKKTCIDLTVWKFTKIGEEGRRRFYLLRLNTRLSITVLFRSIHVRSFQFRISVLMASFCAAFLSAETCQEVRLDAKLFKRNKLVHLTSLDINIKMSYRSESFVT